MSASPRHILGLDIVRFIAAMMVMAYHYQWTWMGWVGVEVFFVLSGFVIAYSAADQTPGQFFKARFVRLMPTIWVCASATAMVHFLVGSFDPSELAERYLKTIILWPGGPWIDGSYWTLTVEIAFYAVVWVTLFRRWISLEAVLCTMAVASTVYWAIHYALHFSRLNPIAATILNYIPMVAERVLLLAYGCYFALGGLLYLSFRDGVTRLRALLGAMCLGTCAVEIFFAAANSVPLDGHRIIPVLVWIALLGVIVLSALYNAATWRLFGRWSPAIRLIGLATYPLYLLHDDIGTAIITKFGIPSWMVALIMICAALTLSDFIEPPIQKWVRRRPTLAKI